MGYKLVFSSIFIYNISLPAEEFVHQSSLEFLKFCAKASVDGSAHIWKILPGVDSIAPVIQAKFVIQGIQIIMGKISCCRIWELPSRKWTKILA